MTTEERVWYCYAVTRPLPAGALEGIRGLRDSTVDTVRHGELTAVVSSVPAAEFEESALRANLENLGWLEEVARRHNDVVDNVARRATTLPFRLATIYLDQQRVQDVLRDNEERITGALDRIEGRSEWGVKVYAEITAQATQPAQSAPAAASSEPPGRSYLRKRMTERQTRDNLWARAEETAAEVDGALRNLAVDRRAHRPQSQQLSGRSEQNVLNVAYLVDDTAVELFLARAEELRAEARGCRVELTGPWVPYSFALPDLETTG